MAECAWKWRASIRWRGLDKSEREVKHHMPSLMRSAVSSNEQRLVQRNQHRVKKVKANSKFSSKWFDMNWPINCTEVVA